MVINKNKGTEQKNAWEVGQKKLSATNLPLAEALQGSNAAKVQVSGSIEEVKRAKLVMIYRRNPRLDRISKALKEKYGNVLCIITIPAGLVGEFLDKLNKATGGDNQTKMLEQGK
ncbi:MAG: hypothetical protein M1530_02590 [Candidatus Marsarchaeota archaeon]|nr:hypothetical protein [Candidatus Marsarchaeota archaeon]